MRRSGSRFAAVAVAMLVAAGAACRRPPLVGEDAAVTDARTTGERPPQLIEAGQETMADSIADTPDDLASSDTPPDMAPVPDAPLDTPPADAPADTAPEDRPSGDGSDVRPDEQPCGPTGRICDPYRCDVARGQCFNSCMTDDDCLDGRPCRASSCGFQPPLCSSNAECLSGFCAQGVCCSSACTRLCSSCALVGQIGTCAPVANGSLEPGGRCPAGNVCNGRGECVPSVCAVDADCGRFHRCTGARCVPCSATCSSNAGCITGAICFDQNGCTACVFPDAGTAGQ